MEKVAIPPARVMRIIWFGFVLSGTMLIYVMFVVPARGPKTGDDIIEIGITIVALVDVALGFFAPRFLKRFANPPLEGRKGATALSAWLSRNLVSIALIYSCNLFAFVLHMLGARSDLVEVLFGVGMISLLLWEPEVPPVTESRKTTPK